MKKTIYILLIFAVGFAISCSSVVNVYSEKLVKKEKTFVVLPFENNTETPLAGLRVASIVEAVASSKGYKIAEANYQREQKEYTQKEIEEMIAQVKEKDIDYVITGSVNEFRYKTGIDGEPAVSIVIKVYDIKNDRLVLNSSGSKTGWSHESVTTTAQKIINKILP